MTVLWRRGGKENDEGKKNMSRVNERVENMKTGKEREKSKNWRWKNIKGIKNW